MSDERSLAAKRLIRRVRSLYHTKGLYSWSLGWEDRSLEENKGIALASIGEEGSPVGRFAKLFYRDPIGRRILEARAEAAMAAHAGEFAAQVRDVYDRALGFDVEERELPDGARS